MDSAFRIPGTRFRFGLDSLVGIIPGLGDLATSVPAGYIIFESYRMGLPTHKLMRQGANVAIDTVVGSVPLVGDLFDTGFKANLRNIAILRDHVTGGMVDVTPPGEDVFTDQPMPPKR